MSHLELNKDTELNFYKLIIIRSDLLVLFESCHLDNSCHSSCSSHSHPHEHVLV